MAATKSKGLSAIGGTGCLLFFVLVWSVGTLGFDCFIARSVFRQIQALGYAEATGSMTLSEVETVRSRRGRTYRPNIQYKYSVEGKEYLGDRYRYGKWSSGGDWAKQIVASRPVGSPVEVYYAPADPSDAVLMVGVEGMDLFVAMFMLPFNLIMLGLWIAGGGAFRYRFLPPPAGGARVSDDGRYLRLRLSPWRPFYWGLIAAGVLALFGAFVIGFGFRGSPPMPLMLVAWGMILGSGALAYLFQHRRLAGSHSDLVIDDFRRSIALPRTFGRHEDLVIPAEKIIAIEVEKAEKRGPKGSVSRLYSPTIIFSGNDGSKRREKIVQWSFEPRATGLAAWLRERLEIKPPTPGDT